MFCFTEHLLHFPGGTSIKEPACQCRGHKRLGFDPWVGKIPWRRKWQPTPVFSPGEFHGQRSLVGYSPWGCKESDLTKHTSRNLTYYTLGSGPSSENTTVTITENYTCYMLVTQLCTTLCNPMDCSPLGSPVREILQARILEWVAISFSRGSSQPRDGILWADSLPSEPSRKSCIYTEAEHDKCVYIYIHTHTHIYIYMLTFSLQKNRVVLILKISVCIRNACFYWI